MWDSEGTLASPQPGPCQWHLPCRRFSCTLHLHYAMTVCLQACLPEIPCIVGMPRGQGAARCHRHFRGPQVRTQRMFWDLEQRMRWHKAADDLWSFEGRSFALQGARRPASSAQLTKWRLRMAPHVTLREAHQLQVVNSLQPGVIRDNFISSARIPCWNTAPDWLQGGVPAHGT